MWTVGCPVRFGRHERGVVASADESESVAGAGADQPKAG